MFEQSTLPKGPAGKQVWTTVLGIGFQVVVVVGMVLVPLIWPDVLPQARALVITIGPPMAPPKAPVGTKAVRPKSAVSTRRAALAYRPLTAPVSVPTGVVRIEDAPEVSFAPAGSGLKGGDGLPGIEGGIPGGIPGGVVTPPPPPAKNPASVAVSPPAIIRIRTSQLDMARIVHRVEPVYPRIAVTARISGTVELRGVIGTDGKIRELKVLRGHPMLVNAAVEAVRQWIYEPTRLSGQAVEVDAPIIVTFRLN